jgi:hypothetical protein
LLHERRVLHQLILYRRLDLRRQIPLQAEFQPVQLVDQSVDHRPRCSLGGQQVFRQRDGLAQDRVRMDHIDPGGCHAEVVVRIDRVRSRWQGVSQLNAERGAFDRFFAQAQQGGQVRDV